MTVSKLSRVTLAALAAARERVGGGLSDRDLIERGLEVLAGAEGEREARVAELEARVAELEAELARVDNMRRGAEVCARLCRTLLTAAEEDAKLLQRLLR